MHTEIAKMVVLTPGAVIPITLQVPRRTYLDFHSDLYPALPLYQSPALKASEWLMGADESLVMTSPQPGKQWGIAGLESKENSLADAQIQPHLKTGEAVTETSAVASDSAISKSTKSIPVPSEDMSEARLSKAPADTTQSEAAQSMALSAKTAVVHNSVASPAVVSPHISAESQLPNRLGIVSATKTILSAKSASHKAPQHWSRTFLAGKTALKPDYGDVHGVASTLAASVQILKVNHTILSYTRFWD